MDMFTVAVRNGSREKGSSSAACRGANGAPEQGPPQCQKTYRKMKPRTSQDQFFSPSQVKVRVLGSGGFGINIIYLERPDSRTWGLA